MAVAVGGIDVAGIAAAAVDLAVAFEVAAAAAAGIAAAAAGMAVSAVVIAAAGMAAAGGIAAAAGFDVDDQFRVYITDCDSKDTCSFFSVQSVKENRGHELPLISFSGDRWTSYSIFSRVHQCPWACACIPSSSINLLSP